jgi:hypothetical protein
MSKGVLLVEGRLRPEIDSVRDAPEGLLLAGCHSQLTELLGEPLVVEQRDVGEAMPGEVVVEGRVARGDSRRQNGDGVDVFCEEVFQRRARHCSYDTSD